MVKNFIKKSYIFLIFFFLYAPIFVLIVYSFNESRSRANWTGFSTKWYKMLFEDQYIMDSLYNTLSIGLISALIATIIGTAAAIGIHSMRKHQKMIVMNVTYLPVLNPDIVTGIAMMLLFIVISIPRGFTSLLIAHITFNIPFVIISVLPKLKQLSKHTLEAALDLGATPLYAYNKVILPQISSGIFTGFLLAFTMSIDDFIVSFFTTGSGVSNLAITIYSMARKGINPKINAILTIMFISVLILLVIINNRMEKDAKKNKV
ncbi:spermidine/putrescine transport system permease protein [Desulfonispora thiosulfatigenes DSM 11270]|uniref:Spermidine/putrescine transport system permease protein n=1 Tax=Desulfonispora thiosulfatigenes DSM 11270 TaxID=656914 RepID=A0A1W1VB39_DESTI|nr:ABC transporter permease [Desulfonispora thiosulfatigenes]SMB90506.1 spermidine/putrescine transport system permease protein [Desulfonispora thiosulfatigenes DSM 11270]